MGRHPHDLDGASDEGSWSPRTRRRHLAATALVLLAVALGAALLVHRAADLDALRDTLADADRGLLVACLATQVLVHVGYGVAVRWLIGVDGGPAPPFGAVVGLNLASLGATRLVAIAGAGGIAVTYWAFRQLGQTARDARARVLTLHIGVYAVFAAIGWSAAIVAGLVGFDAPRTLVIGWALGVPACVAAAVLVCRREPPADARPGRLRAARAAVIGGLAGVGRMVRAPRESAPFALGCLLFWGADMACLAFAIRAVGGDLPPVGVVLAFATGYVAMLAPLPTGGFGAVDVAVTFALLMLDVELTTAIAAVALWRGVNFWLPTIPALIALTRVREVARALRTARAPTRT